MKNVFLELSIIAEEESVDAECTCEKCNYCFDDYGQTIGIVNETIIESIV